MDKIIGLFNDLITVDDDGKGMPVPISYRERGYADIPGDASLPRVTIQPSSEGYEVSGWALSTEQLNQIVEQVIGKFRDKDRTNKERNLSLNRLQSNSHGSVLEAEFIIGIISS